LRNLRGKQYARRVSTLKRCQSSKCKSTCKRNVKRKQREMLNVKGNKNLKKPQASSKVERDASVAVSVVPITPMESVLRN